MKYGYGSALATFLVMVCLVFTVIINTVFNRLENKVSREENTRDEPCN